jgi:hypothetical protein
MNLPFDAISFALAKKAMKQAAIPPDNVTLEVGPDGRMRIKDLGVTDEKIAGVSAGKITGRISTANLPTAPPGQYLRGQGLGVDPAYQSIPAGDIPGLDASKIISGRFPLARLPDAPLGQFLSGGGLAADPVYRAIALGDLPAGTLSSRVSLDHTSTSFTLAGGAEASIATVSGNGTATILFAGNGAGVFNMRVYVDGVLEDSFPSNEQRIGVYSFTTSLEVRVHNPGAAATSTSSSFNIRGVAR